MNDELLRQYIRTSLQEIKRDPKKRGGVSKFFTDLAQKVGLKDYEEEPEKIGAGLIELPNPMLIQKVVPLMISASLKGTKGGYESYLKQNGISETKAKASAAFMPGNWVKMCEVQYELLMKDTGKAYRKLYKDGSSEDKEWFRSWIVGEKNVADLFEKSPRSFMSSIQTVDTLIAVYGQNRDMIQKSGFMLITPDKDIPAVASVMGGKVGQEIGKELGVRAVKKTGKTAGKKMVGVALKVAGKAAGAAFQVLDVADVIEVVRKMGAADNMFEEMIKNVFDPRSGEILLSVSKGKGPALVLKGDEFPTTVAGVGKKKDAEET